MTRLRLARWIVRVLAPQCAVVPMCPSEDACKHGASVAAHLADTAPTTQSFFVYRAMIAAAEGER